MGGIRRRRKEEGGGRGRTGAGDRQFFWTWSQDFWRSDRNTFWTPSAPKLAQSGASDLGHPAGSSKWTAESRVNGWHPLPKRSPAILPKSGAGDRQFFWTQSQDFWRSDRNTFWTSSTPKLAQSEASAMRQPAVFLKWAAESRTNGCYRVPKRSPAILPVRT